VNVTFKKNFNPLTNSGYGGKSANKKKKEKPDCPLDIREGNGHCLISKTSKKKKENERKKKRKIETVGGVPSKLS